MFQWERRGLVSKSRIRWTGHTVYVGLMRHVNKILVREPKGKRPLVRLTLEQEDNIKLDHAQDRDQWWNLAIMVMNLQAPQKVGNFLIS
jgi:hypothetical protein